MARRASSEIPGNSGVGSRAISCDHLLGLGERAAGGVHAQLGDLDLARQRAALEVVPEARQGGALGLQARELRTRLVVDGLGCGELLLGRLLLGELAAVVLRQVRTALALLLLPRKVAGELRDQLAP